MNTAEKLQWDPGQVAGWVQDIGIPPRPALLRSLSEEIAKDDPALCRLRDIVELDVALSAHLIKSANSPLLGLSKPAQTVEQAFLLLGFARCLSVLTEMCVRRSFPAGGTRLEAFWQHTSLRGQVLGWLARETRWVAPDIAHTFGLFSEVGVPLMLQRFHFPSYEETLTHIEQQRLPRIEAERARHRTDHALIGSLAARAWGVSQTVELATRLHHDDELLLDVEVPRSVRVLMAMGLVSDRLIELSYGGEPSVEWELGGAPALECLGVDEAQLMDWWQDVGVLQALA